MNRPSNAIGIKLIVGYKFAKAAAELFLGASLLMLGTAGLAERINEAAEYVRHHAAEAWSIALAERLVSAATGRNLLVVVLAILLDGVFSFFEGWSLHRRYAWSRWLIVGATASFLPVECVALARHLSAGRVVILIVNVLIVVYLIRGRVTAKSDTG